ncbi:suppressor APC domain-containing protein 1 isoform 2-T2 [Odontesthes bonariensis]|uniref:suppressor APC domain-containing protein 2 n=1 Tax=Odontesthes bonariensis TaxID=219752 RepID=UPI003F58CE6A
MWNFSVPRPGGTMLPLPVYRAVFFPLLPSLPHTHSFSLWYYSESPGVEPGFVVCGQARCTGWWQLSVTDLLSMACRPYAVVIIPLKTSLCSLDALRFYLWIKRLKDLEKEKDALWSGLAVLEKARLWYLQQLQENRARQNIESRYGSGTCHKGAAEARSCLLRSHIQRVNGSLGSVMTEPNVMSSSNPSIPEAVADSDLRWHNTVLTQEVSDKNHQIALLELEKDALLEQLEELQAS